LEVLFKLINSLLAYTTPFSCSDINASRLLFFLTTY
jgi:hypothetical protein